jgi:HAD superfamily hydrolase (TIGR01549 family)
VRPRPSSLRAVLFDWDGTLVDSAGVSFRSYVSLFASFGIAFGREEFERTYSPNWYVTYAGVGLPKDKWEEADARWLRLYGTEPSPLLPGAARALAQLRSAGLAQGLVSSGSRERVAGDLVRLEVSAFFHVVVCGGDTENRKPHPEPLIVALERLGVAATEAAYVGDSPEDVEMARNAGVFAVGIPGGFPNRAALEASSPDVLAGNLDEALQQLVGLGESPAGR